MGEGKLCESVEENCRPVQNWPAMGEMMNSGEINSLKKLSEDGVFTCFWATDIDTSGRRKYPGARKAYKNYDIIPKNIYKNMA